MILTINTDVYRHRKQGTIVYPIMRGMTGQCGHIKERNLKLCIELELERIFRQNTS